MTKRKPARTTSVVEQLGIEIVGGNPLPGGTMPAEPELEARFQVSRSVVREAVRMLAAKGLVSVRQRHGTHVRPRHEWSWLDRDLIGWIAASGISRADLLAFAEARRIIEPEAAALAAARATDAQREAISAAYKAMTRDRHDPARAISADKAFHLAILDATHNPVLQSLHGAIDALLSAIFDFTVTVFEGNLDNHGAVAAAIETRDADAAREAMRSLLSYTSAYLEQR